MTYKITEFKAIAFDLYGTLVRIKNPLNPYLSAAKLLGVDSRQFFQKSLTTNLDLTELVGNNASVNLEGILLDIEREISSVDLYPDVIESLEYLKSNNKKLGIISNLAKPYGSVVDELLPGKFDAKILSYEVGHRKPEPEIFKIFCERLNVSPEEVLMIGDSISSDVEGARRIGMKALYLNRAHRFTKIENIVSLKDLL